MQEDHVEYKEEECMGDCLQIFHAYKEERDRREAAEKKLASLCASESIHGGAGMTDLQFLEYKRVCDELAEAKREIEALKAKNKAE